MAEVKKVEVLDGYRVRLRFADGFVREIDLEPYLWGPMFEAVRQPKTFRRVKVESGTIVWPNGADICADTLYHAIAPDKLDDVRFLRKIPGLLPTPSRLHRAPAPPRSRAPKRTPRRRSSS
jgi:uncharacterized protein DUF2442